MEISQVGFWLSPQFERWAARTWSTPELTEFLEYLARHPELGAIIPETGGARKIRWRVPGKGKPGGARVIHYFPFRGGRIYVLMGYSKSEKVDLSPADRHTLAEALMPIKQALRTK
ncbi:MAG: hypothetical protein FJX59_10455 [Alphaproteobacteria bacterium]|nr:hypothetical protein [Alphaproteobacteria bacterium]